MDIIGHIQNVIIIMYYRFGYTLLLIIIQSITKYGLFGGVEFLPIK